MKERPIIFSAPMVRAILAGNKVQTRRIMKPQPDIFNDLYLQSMPSVRGLACYRVVGPDYPDNADDDHLCRYGDVGDRLWVRETWLKSAEGRFIYRADSESIPGENKWRPSMLMPTFVSRIRLEITQVRVERLQSISEADALSEGVAYPQLPDNQLDTMRARTWFRGLWETIHGYGSWDVNPWVWVIEFKRINDSAIV